MKKRINRMGTTAMLIVAATLSACSQQPLLNVQGDEAKGNTWAEKLDFELGKKVLILHADDAGMIEEANEATQNYLLAGDIQSAAAMAPAPSFEPFIEWAKAHPEQDIGLHLTMTSEWKSYRWPSVLEPATVQGLIDEETKLWSKVIQVVSNASADEVEREIRAQIERSLALGYRPNHLDTHMGTLYADVGFTRAFLKVSQEYGIPANVVDLSNPEVVTRFRKIGFPVNDEMIQLVGDYTLPKLDNFTSVPKGKSYEDVRAKFFEQVRSLKPGLTEIIFHPTLASDRIKSGAIMNSWPQREWEAHLFSDPEVKQFFKNEASFSLIGKRLCNVLSSQIINAFI